MAKCSPYFDPRAHGSLSDALTFRVFRGTTRLGKKNFPRNVKSAAQLVQRAKFKAASDAYNILNPQWLTFLYDRGISINDRGRDLFLSAHMKDVLPSTNPGITMDSLKDMVIFNTAGIETYSLKMSVFRPPLEYYTHLWNKHQDSNLFSEVGPDGINTGATFVPGYWGNCARIAAVGQNVKYQGLFPSLDPNSFILSWWMNTDTEVLNGHPVDGLFHTVFQLIFATDAGSRFTMMGIFPNTRKTFISDSAGYQIINTTVDWAASSWHRFCLVRDQYANFDGTKTMALYVDGVEIGNTSVALETYVNPVNDTLYLGAQQNPNVPLRGNIDNPKVTGPVTAKLLSDTLANQDTEDLPNPELMGSIFDSENIFTPVVPEVEGPAYILTVENNYGNPERIPMDYLLTLHWFRSPDDYGSTKVRLPKMAMDGYGGINFYIAADGSLYWDEAMTQIACTPKMYYAKTT